MSSFVLLTQHGPPDLIVEVGTPISQDPVMLSGLFKAIVSFTDEVTQAPLQVLQTKGFTVQFKPMFEDFILIVGTNHTITGLDLILEQISQIVDDGYKHEVEPYEIEASIAEVLNNYIEFTAVGTQPLDGIDQLPVELLEMFSDIDRDIYKILFYAMLAGYPISYPKTNSMDLNRNLTRFISFLEMDCCSDFDPECEGGLVLQSKDGKFEINSNSYHHKEIQKTAILKELLDLVKQKNFLELKIKLISELGTLNQMEHYFIRFNYIDHSDAEQNDIDQLRYILGHELEHYLLLRLNRRDPGLVTYLQENTKQTEWMSQW